MEYRTNIGIGLFSSVCLLAVNFSVPPNVSAQEPGGEAIKRQSPKSGKREADATVSETSPGQEDSSAVKAEETASDNGGESPASSARSESQPEAEAGQTRPTEFEVSRR